MDQINIFGDGKIKSSHARLLGCTGRFFTENIRISSLLIISHQYRMVKIEIVYKRGERSTP